MTIYSLYCLPCTIFVQRLKTQPIRKFKLLSEKVGWKLVEYKFKMKKSLFYLLSLMSFKTNTDNSIFQNTRLKTQQLTDGCNREVTLQLLMSGLLRLIFQIDQLSNFFSLIICFDLLI